MKKNPVTLDPNLKNGYIPAPYEDWRNSDEIRAEDMVKHLPVYRSCHFG